MPTRAVRVTDLLVGKNSLGYLSLVPGASVLIRQNGVALVGSAGPGTPAVFSDNNKTPMTNPVPTGVSQGTAGVDTAGRLVVYLNPGKGYDVQATVGNVSTTASLPDVGVDVDDVAEMAATRVANPQTVDYTLVLTDAGKAIEVSSATAKSVTVPPNATVAFPLGTVLEVAQAAAGAVSLVAGAGVTFEGGTTTPAQGGSLLLRKLGTDNWRVIEWAPRGTYVPSDPVVAITYNADGTAATSTENGVVTSFTYNADGTVATTTRLGVTRTYTYADGNLTAVA